MLRSMVAMVSSLSLAACSVIGVRSGTEEPAYTVVGHAGTAEIRTYGPGVAAETQVAGDEIAARSEGFQRLAGYIFGGNRKEASIAMTAPVGQSRGGQSGGGQSGGETIAMTAPVVQAREGSNAWTVRFIMPAKYTLETLPTPDDPRVHLVALPPRTFAVLRFTGSIGTAAIGRQQAALAADLAHEKLVASGPPTAWFYDPPWTLPFLRRNEVAVPLDTPNKGTTP